MYLSVHTITEIIKLHYIDAEERFVIPPYNLLSKTFHAVLVASTCFSIHICIIVYAMRRSKKNIYITMICRQ